MKRLIWRFLLFFLLGIFIGIHYLLPLLIVRIRFPLYSSENVINQHEGSKFTFTTCDGIELTGHHYTTMEASPKASIILIHGIRSNQTTFQNISHMLNKKGYNAITLDLRAHGKSGGNYSSFGYYEKQDISALIDFLERNNCIYNEPLGVWGQSLGGAVAIQSLANDRRIKFGIVESTFTDYQQIVGDYIERLTGIKSVPLKKHLIHRAASIANFNPNLVSPIKDCAKITVPILLAHGDKDNNIHVSYAKRNFEQLKNKNNELIIIENAGHNNLWTVGGANYFDKVFSFLSKVSKISSK